MPDPASRNTQYLFTSESVSDGHPDKICDQISDAVLDACLAINPNARVAAETAVKDHEVILLGEISKGADAFRPARIIKRLNLRRPIFRPTATFGHFGREEFPWEQ